MKLILLIGILAALASLSLIIVVALWRHKKLSAANLKLIGEVGEATTTLDPEGAVLVHGELWRARSRDGAAIAAGARVRVLGVEGHLVLVEVCDWP